LNCAVRTIRNSLPKQHKLLPCTDGRQTSYGLAYFLWHPSGFLLFFCSYRGSITYTCVDIDSSVYMLIFTFVEANGEAFYKETRAALSVVKEGMSDLQKIIALHDYLAINCKYDYQNYLDDTIPDESYSAYGVLVNHTGVCQGYMLAYGYLLEQVGIRSFRVRSTAMNHTWNLVELDGSYYHVDVTWDDPTWDCVGRARHQYMLKSDGAFRFEGEGHYGWEVSDVGYSAVNRKYDNAFWNDVDSPLVLDGEQWNDCYFIVYDSGSRTGKIKKTSLSALSGAGTEIADIGRWTVWGNTNSYWQCAYSGLFQYQNRLYYNDTSSICQSKSQHFMKDSHEMMKCRARATVSKTRKNTLRTSQGRTVFGISAILQMTE